MTTIKVDGPGSLHINSQNDSEIETFSGSNEVEVKTKMEERIKKSTETEKSEEIVSLEKFEISGSPELKSEEKLLEKSLEAVFADKSEVFEKSEISSEIAHKEEKILFEKAESSSTPLVKNNLVVLSTPEKTLIVFTDDSNKTDSAENWETIEILNSATKTSILSEQLVQELKASRVDFQENSIIEPAKSRKTSEAIFGNISISSSIPDEDHIDQYSKSTSISTTETITSELVVTTTDVETTGR